MSLTRAARSADEARWFKSSYSGQDNGGGCVSAAALAEHVGVRDSKQADGPAVLMPATAWAAFVNELRAGRL